MNGTDLHHEADVVRLYVEAYRYTALGDEASVQSRMRVLDALRRLEEAAAKKEAA